MSLQIGDAMAKCFLEKASGDAWVKIRKSDGKWVAIRVSKLIAIEDGCNSVGEDCTSVVYDTRVGCSCVQADQAATGILNSFAEEPVE